MAALDFGMALARGMLPTSEKAQKDLINLAGGRNIFKSEDWWNKQVDKQISEGYRETERQTGYLSKTGEVLPQAGTTTRYYTLGFMNQPQYYQPNLMMGMGAPYTGGISNRWQTETSPIAPEGALKIGEENVLTRKSKLSAPGLDEYTKMGVYYTKPIDVFTANAKRKDYTAGELSDIESSAKAGAERARREAATKTATQRKKRGTGGLAAKAIKPGDKPVTGLPELGTGGLGLGATTLGKGLLV